MGNLTSRRDFFRKAGASALGLAAARGYAQSRKEKPNLIVILADDLGYGDLGCYGNRRVRTPNIDALAAGGMRFSDFHASGPVCSPTRAGLMTGRYQQRCGIDTVIFAEGPRDTGLAPEEPTFAGQLKQAGYRTAIFGKWHLGYLPRFNPDKHGFDEFRGYVSGNVDYFSHVDQAGYADWWHNSKLEPEEGYTTELVTNHSVRFIEENKDRPFCLYIAHEAVHAPYQGPHDKAQRSVNQKGKPVPGNLDVSGTYREMTEAMDEGIGKVIAAVKRAGLERDTFIFFFSDNGATARGSNGSLRGFKGSLWEGGQREPAIAYWPGVIAPGQVSKELAISLDVFPTLVALGKAPMPDRKLDGVNLVPLLTRHASLGERMLFWAHGKQRAVRQGRWKLVQNATGAGTAKPMLFDLESDIGEKNDLAATQPDRVKTLAAALAAWDEDIARSARPAR